MIRKLIVISCLLASGCLHPQTEWPKNFPDNYVERPKPKYSSGSLWQDSSVSLSEDFKARRPGDVVTIVISEQASASKEAKTATKRDAAITASIPNFMGLETTALADKLNLNALIKASAASSYDGSGSTDRKDTLTATMTARVTDMLPNGNLRIMGRKSVKVNNEEQIIILEGTIRTRDITQDNLVSSSQIADARITYAGKGLVNDRQQPGWLLNIIDKIWPF